MNLSHLDENHKPKMVDVSDKKITKREAIASGYITMSKEAFENVENDKNKKGPVLQTAVISAIMGAKKTHEIIPMCHPLMLSGIKCDIEKNEQKYQYKLIATVKNSGQTGVEMEALSAVSIGLLTIYDMLKAIDKSMIISGICLEEKKGGASGNFKRTL
ncbi:MAG: cyclic pyranopterin monophosphate synthase MoaC [Methylococcales bacterium]|nr:cyclic pyranopterin monophosphate synthase MoaC [Methylococcales bacterium]